MSKFDEAKLHSESAVNEVGVGRQDEPPITLRPLDKDTFGLVNVFSLAFSCINSWVALVAAFGTALVSGGPTALVWGLVYGTTCTFCTVLSHGELFAVFPTAAGQYHWSALASSPRWRAPVSWATGMFNVIGLWLGIAAAAYLCGNMVTAMILVNNPDFVITPAKQYGIFVAMTMFAPLSSLGVGSKVNRRIEFGLMVLSVAGALTIVITLLATSSPKASAKWVFGGTNNGTGWDSIVIAWLIGLLQSSYAYVGFDIVYHVSEEMSNPKKDGPTAANWTILLSGASSWVVIVCLLFSIEDLDRVLNTPYRLPFAQVVMDATGSKACTTIFILIILIVFSNATRGNTISASRTLLSFGRDGMLPYGHYFTIVKLGEPVWGIVLSVVVSLLVGLVQFGPAAAFNSLLGGATIFFFISYTIPCACMLLGGRAKLNRLFPDRQHNLGRWGVVCNLVAVFFVVQSIVIYCFPASMPVTADSMNYVIVFAAFFLAMLVIIWYTYARSRYQGPKSTFLDNMFDEDIQEEAQ